MPFLWATHCILAVARIKILFSPKPDYCNPISQFECDMSTELLLIRIGFPRSLKESRIDKPNQDHNSLGDLIRVHPTSG